MTTYYLYIMPRPKKLNLGTIDLSDKMAVDSILTKRFPKANGVRDDYNRLKILLEGFQSKELGYKYAMIAPKRDDSNTLIAYEFDKMKKSDLLNKIISTSLESRDFKSTSLGVKPTEASVHAAPASTISIVTPRSNQKKSKSGDDKIAPSAPTKKSNAKKCINNHFNESLVETET